MNSLIVWIRNCLRLLKLKAKAIYVEASMANAEADIEDRTVELNELWAIYNRRVETLRTILREIAVRESPEVVVKQIIKETQQ